MPLKLSMLQSRYIRPLGQAFSKLFMRFAYATSYRFAEFSLRGNLTFQFATREFDSNQVYELDILVDDCVVIELKTVEKVLPVHDAQSLSYLKLTGHRLGFLLNFKVPIMKHGIKRIAL